MSALPIRVRLTLAFAFVMAAVLAGMGFFVYVRVGNALVASVDQALASQAREAASHAHEGHSLVDPDVAGGSTLGTSPDGARANSYLTMIRCPLAPSSLIARFRATAWLAVPASEPSCTVRVANRSIPWRSNSFSQSSRPRIPRT